MNHSQIADDAYRGAFDGASKITRHTQTREEAALHAVRTILAKLDDWDGRPIENWAAIIGRNKAIDIRKKFRREAEYDSLEYPMEAVSQPEEQDYTALHAAVAKLSPKKRELITLHYFKRMEMQTIAEETGYGLSDVKISVMRARRQLKEILDKQSNS